MDPYTPLYTNLICSAATRVANTESDKSFRILVVNFSDHCVDVLPKEVVASSPAHPNNLVESHIWHAKMLHLIPDDRDTNFRQRHVHIRDIDIVNKNLTDQREKHMGKDEKLVMARDFPMNVPSDMEAYIRSMLRNHENMWSAENGVRMQGWEFSVHVDDVRAN